MELGKECESMDIRGMIRQMTLEEKAGLCSGQDFPLDIAIALEYILSNRIDRVLKTNRSVRQEVHKIMKRLLRSICFRFCRPLARSC